MISAELVAQKFQNVLGSQYKLCVDHAFRAAYVKPTPSPYGLEYTIDHQAFNEYKNTIMAVVATTNNSLVSSPFRADNLAYTVQFWVPLDFLKINSDGTLIEAPKFDFYSDIERLKTALNNTEIAIATGLKAFFTISDPSVFGNVEKSGAYARMPMQILGQVAIYDSKLSTGSKYKIKVVLGGTEYEFENYTDYTEGRATDSNYITDGNSVVPKQEIAATSWECAFMVDDYNSANNPEIKLLEDICRAFKTELTPTASTAEKKYKVLTRLYTNTTLTKEFWGIISAEHIIPGKAGFCKYKVSITYSGE